MRRGRRGPHPPMRDGARRDPLKRAAAAPPAPALRISIPLAPRASSGRARATRRHLRAPESTPRNSAAPSPTFGLTARASAPITRAVRRSCREPTASAARRPMPHANARAMCRSPGATANRLPDIVLPIPDRLDARMEPPKSAASPSATRHEHRSPRGCVARRRLFIPAGCRTIGEPFHEACALPSFTKLPRLIQHDARRFCADALRFARARTRSPRRSGQHAPPAASIPFTRIFRSGAFQSRPNRPAGIVQYRLFPRRPNAGRLK